MPLCHPFLQKKDILRTSAKFPNLRVPVKTQDFLNLGFHKKKTSMNNLIFFKVKSLHNFTVSSSSWHANIGAKKNPSYIMSILFWQEFLKGGELEIFLLLWIFVLTKKLA